MSPPFRMTSTLGESEAIGRSQASQQSPSHTMLMSSSELAMTSTHPPLTFCGIDDLKHLIASKYERLQRDGKDQYVRLKLVSKADFNHIECHRREIGAMRLTYFPEIETLIAKIPSKPHEKSHLNLGMILKVETHIMGIGLREFSAIGATKYTGPTNSSKECDSSWVNALLRPNGYPLLVIEAGVSESLNQLRLDAAWWVANSGGQVKLILLIHVIVLERKVNIEKYVPYLATTPATRRTASRSAWKPKKVGATIKIDQAAVSPTIQGAPLVLPFQSVIGRTPVPPREHDITISATTLLEWALDVFA